MFRNSYHTPVMVRECIDHWLTDPSGVYVDGMVGGGGHSAALLKLLDRKGRIIGIDCDADAVAHCRERFAGEERIIIQQGHFSEIASILHELGIGPVSGLFADTGVSSYQLDTAAKGHAYLQDGPLDLRLDSSGPVTASDLINTASEKVLADIIFQYGEERHSRRIARRIAEARKEGPITTTARLARIVGAAAPPKYRNKTLARVWQAFRFKLNRELEELREGLERMYPLMKTGGSMVVISYESLMDRMVKRFFRGLTPSFQKEAEIEPTGYVFEIITRKVLRPSEAEVGRNSRSRSARLRCARKM